MTKQSIRRYCCVHKFYEGGVENDFIRLICPMKIYPDNFDQIDTWITQKTSYIIDITGMLISVELDKERN